MSSSPTDGPVVVEVALPHLSPTTLTVDEQRLILRAGVMLQEWRTLPFGIWLEGWHLLLVLVALIGLAVLVARGKLRWELALFTFLSIFVPLMTRVMAIGRFATLTWLPLVLIGLILL